MRLMSAPKAPTPASCRDARSRSAAQPHTVREITQDNLLDGRRHRGKVEERGSIRTQIEELGRVRLDRQTSDSALI
jgi:hypothetical protein